MAPPGQNLQLPPFWVIVVMKAMGVQGARVALHGKEGHSSLSTQVSKWEIQTQLRTSRIMGFACPWKGVTVLSRQGPMQSQDTMCPLSSKLVCLSS